MRFIVAGGGTGGHVYPALAIAKGLQEKLGVAEILYVGTNKGLEADIIPKAGLSFAPIKVEGFTRPISYRTFLSGIKAVGGCWEAGRIMRRFKPHVVVGTGGYVCGPVVLAAALSGIPTLIHEQNAVPGLTNRLLARVADRICLTFEDSLKYFSAKKKVALTGLPIRKEIILAERVKSLQDLGLAEEKVTIVVTGGSRGAQSLNLAMATVYDQLRGDRKIQFYHITGQAGYEETLALLQKKGIELSPRGSIKIVPYLYQMEQALAASDIIVGRAGASFLSEIMVRGIPSVLVPYPYAAGNHQEFNAQSLEKRGAAKVVLDQDLSGEKLFTALQEIINNASLRAEMAQAARKMGKINALDDITNMVVGISRGSKE